MYMADLGATNLNIFCSYGEKTYTIVSEALLSSQSFNHCGTQGNFRLISKLERLTVFVRTIGGDI